MILPWEQKLFARLGPAAKLCSFDFGGDSGPTTQTTTQVTEQETNISVTNYVTTPPVSVKADFSPIVNIPVDLSPIVNIPVDLSPIVNIPVDLSPIVNIPVDLKASVPVSFGGDLLKPIAETYAPLVRSLENTIAAYRTDTRAALDAITAGAAATVQSQKQATDAAMASLKNVDRLNADLRRTVSYPKQAPVTASAVPSPLADPGTALTLGVILMVLTLWLVLQQRRSSHAG